MSEKSFGTHLNNNESRVKGIWTFLLWLVEANYMENLTGTSGFLSGKWPLSYILSSLYGQGLKSYRMGLLQFFYEIRCATVLPQIGTGCLKYAIWDARMMARWFYPSNPLGSETMCMLGSLFDQSCFLDDKGIFGSLISFSPLDVRCLGLIAYLLKYCNDSVVRMVV